MLLTMKAIARPKGIADFPAILGVVDSLRLDICKFLRKSAIKRTKTFLLGCV
jgi:hypothetical protein